METKRLDQLALTDIGRFIRVVKGQNALEGKLSFFKPVVQEEIHFSGSYFRLGGVFVETSAGEITLPADSELTYVEN